MFHCPSVLLYVRFKVKVFQCNIFRGFIRWWHYQDKVFPFCTLPGFSWGLAMHRSVYNLRKEYILKNFLTLSCTFVYLHITSNCLGVGSWHAACEISIFQLLLPVMPSENHDIRHRNKAGIFIWTLLMCSWGVHQGGNEDVSKFPKMMNSLYLYFFLEFQTKKKYVSPVQPSARFYCRW